MQRTFQECLPKFFKFLYLYAIRLSSIFYLLRNFRNHTQNIYYIIILIVCRVCVINFCIISPVNAVLSTQRRFLTLYAHATTCVDQTVMIACSLKYERFEAKHKTEKIRKTENQELLYNFLINKIFIQVKVMCTRKNTFWKKKLSEMIFYEDVTATV